MSENAKRMALHPNPHANEPVADLPLMVSAPSEQPAVVISPNETPSEAAKQADAAQTEAVAAATTDASAAAEPVEAPSLG